MAGARRRYRQHCEIIFKCPSIHYYHRFLGLPRIMTEKLIICENTHKGIIPVCINPLLIIYCEPISGVYVPIATRDHLRDWFFIHRWQEHMEFTVQIQQTWTGVTFSSFSLQRQVPLLGYCGLYKINQNKHKTFLLIFYSKYQLLLSQVAFLCSRGVLAVRHPPPLLWGQRGVNTVCHSDLRKYNSMCGRPRT